MYIDDIPTGNLKYGYTTGACATAATLASLTGLITGHVPGSVKIILPNKKEALFQIENALISGNYAESSVIKDGGDDPDVTTGLHIYSTVSFISQDKIIVDGGQGVGRVTLEGLPVKPGNAAINPVPMRMIRKIIIDTLAQYGITSGIKAVISVPGGENVALKTYNPKLGIMGGISILGTTGIVTPFSSSSWKASIALSMRVAMKNNTKTFIFTTGGRSDSEAKKIYGNYGEENFIEIGDFIGFSLKRAMDYGVERIFVVGMPGKMSKLAAGNMNLHSSESKIDLKMLSEIAEECNMGEYIKDRIGHANTVSQVMEIINFNGEFMNIMRKKIISVLSEYTKNRIEIEVNII